MKITQAVFVGKVIACFLEYIYSYILSNELFWLVSYILSLTVKVWSDMLE